MATLGKFLFKYRGYVPIPFVLLVLFLSSPSTLSAFLGTPLILGGELLRLWAVAHAGPATRSRSIEVNSLTTAGPYAHLRHPIYVGNFLISLGFLVCFNSWMPYMLIPFLCLFCLQYALIARAEERQLRATFGAKYDAYMSEVRAFLPKLKPYLDWTNDPPQFREALRSESQTMWTIGAVYLLLLLRWTIASLIGV